MWLNSDASNDIVVFFIGDLSFAEDGRVKYKVKFEGKGKSLVSGHHIAFDSTPKLDQLYIGARVVVETEENLFQTGILAELPGRKNRSRYPALNKYFERTSCKGLICCKTGFNLPGSWSFWIITCRFTQVYLHFIWCANRVSIPIIFYK